MAAIFLDPLPPLEYDLGVVEILTNQKQKQEKENLLSKKFKGAKLEAAVEEILVLEKNLMEELSLYNKLEDEKLKPEKKKALGKCYYQLADKYFRFNTDYPAAENQRKCSEYLHAALNFGNDEAQLVFGLYYGNGRHPMLDPVPPAYQGIDYAMAFMYYGLAAAQGNPMAENYLGNCYRTGTGISKNLSLAFQYYERAAHKELYNAVKMLCFCYAYGIGVERHTLKALEYFRRSEANVNKDVLVYTAFT